MEKIELNLLNEFISNKDISQSEKDTIIGTTLGDNHIRRSSKTSLVSLTYGYYNKIYSNFVLSKLKNLSNQVSAKENKNLDTRYNKIRFSYSFSIRGLSSLISFGNLFTKLIIKDGKEVFVKVIPSFNIMYELLTPGALAFWIMDDGHNYKRGGITLCTDSFTLIEVQTLIKVLEQKFKLSCTLHKKKNKIGTSYYYRIYIRSCSLPLLHSLVSEYMLTEMMYKIKFRVKDNFSQTKKNIKARASRQVIKDWQKKHGPNTFPPKPSRVYSSNPRAIKARLARQAKKQIFFPDNSK